jgi:hypothetical protein
MTAMRRRQFLIGGMALAAGCAAPPEHPEDVELSAPRGPYAGETAALRRAVQATVVLAMLRERAIVALDVASGRRSTLAAMPAPVRQLSAPDDRGAVAIVTAAAGERRYAVRLLADGRERTVIEGTGDPLWDDPIGAPALSGDGQWLLAVAQPQAEARYQPLFVGLLRCWNTGDGRERTLRAKPVLALGERPAWASSSREIVYAAPGPQGLASAAPLAPAMQPDPQIRRLDLATGRDELLTAGHHPVLSSDGQSMLLRPPGPRGWRWWHIASASAQPMAPVAGLRVPLALVDSRYLIYTGEPSPGAPVGNTVNNSPLAGPKPMLALKVSNLASGAHETLLDGIDPRLVLAARGGAMLSRP